LCGVSERRNPEVDEAVNLLIFSPGRLAASLSIGLLLGCGGPLGPIPGGMLDGPRAPRMGDPAVLGASGIGELETDPRDPYSVTVAYNVIDGVIYVNAGGEAKRWARNALADPDVRFRVDGEIHELRAVRVTDPAEIARFGEAWTQGWFRRDPTGYEEVWVFRLLPPADSVPSGDS
jgi:hypothetical protein